LADTTHQWWMENIAARKYGASTSVKDSAAQNICMEYMM
jgi:hypothetical protein